MRYVIIGASAAGLNAAREIRRLDADGPILVISDEPHPPYSRILTTHLIGGRLEPDGMRMQPSDFFAQHNIELRLGTRAARVDTERRRVMLEDGTAVDYDRLLVATGANPKMPNIPGADLEGVQAMRTLDDARSVLDRLSRIKAAVFSGGGLTSCKTAEVLLRRSIKVSMVVTSDRILSQMLDREGAEIVQNRAQRLGVDVITRNDLAEILGDDRGEVSGVVLRDGTRIPCQLVVVGKGVAAATEILENTPVEVEYGILVDEYMRTAVPEVFAAGDVVQGFDLVRGETWTNAVWPLAVEQGRIAGHNMAHGAEMTYPGGVGVNTGDFFGLPAVAIGLVRQQGEDIDHVKRLEPGREYYQSIVLRDNRIIGYLCVGNVAGAGLFHHLIRHKVEVTPKLTSELVRKGGRFPVLLRNLPATAHTLFKVGENHGPGYQKRETETS